LDNETAQITAQMVDTNGVTNIVSGVVERNGTFWLEDLPLNPGTNQVVITATDAAGNSSATNLTLFQSGVTLTINPVSDDQLNQSVTTVSGTVSDPSYSVWINGVQAVVDGSGNWTTNNVPVYGNGTATFDVIAYPPGQSSNRQTQIHLSNNVNNPQPIQTSLVSEQPPTVFVSSYSDKWEEVVTTMGGLGLYQTSWGASKYYTANIDSSGRILYQGKGAFFDHIGGGMLWFDTTYDWSETSSSYSSIGYEWYYGENDPNNEFPIDENGPGIGGYEVFPGVYDIPSGGGSHFFAKISYDWTTNQVCFDAVDTTYSRSSKTQIKLRTGGKSGKGRQNLFTISGSVAGYGRPAGVCWCEEWMGTPSVTIARNQIRVLGRNLGSDGNLYIVLPDNATLDLGAVAPGRHYSLGVGATKHKMYIQANGHILRPNRIVPLAKFCVGQQIGFAPVWSPTGPPNVASVSYLWDLSTKFVNHSTQPSSSGSVKYDIILALLDVESPSVWYVSGGDKNAYLHVFLHFSNGQSATVDASGQFSMFRPSILGHGQVSQGAVELNTNGLPTVKLGMLAAGADFIHWSTDVGLDTSFSANLFHVQLVDWESMYDIGLYCISKYTGTSGLYWLDNSDPYSDGLWPVNPDGGKNYVTVKGISFGDGPDISGNFCSFAQLTPSFKSYLCFQPTSAGSIPITLERVEWGEHGRTDLTSGIWIMTTSNITGPSFSDDDSFPFWEQVFSNTSGN